MIPDWQISVSIMTQLYLRPARDARQLQHRAKASALWFKV